MTNIELFKQIVDELTTIYEAKNADYGNSFDKTCDEFGIVAALVRMNDKLNRLIQLSKTDAKVKDESVEDTLKDLANYAILTLIWFKNKTV